MRLTQGRSLSLVFALIAILALAGCNKEKKADHQPPADLAVGADVGNAAPDFTLKNIAGGTLQLSSLRGKAVIVDFWDTWCPPCRRAMPALQAVADEYADDLVVVGVAFGRDGEEKVRSFAEQNNLSFPMVLADEEFQVVKDFGNFQSIPTTFLISRDGVIAKRWSGGHSREEYAGAVKEVLGL